jgi:hypothetical protein
MTTPARPRGTELVPRTAIVTNDDILTELRALRAEFRAAFAPVDNSPPPRDDLSVDQAAALAEVSPSTVRNWIKKHKIGTWHPAFVAYVISRKKLRAHLIAHRGAERLPPALKDVGAP